MTDPISLLLLADSRLPAGTHAHSGGLEAAVAAGRVRDAAGLYAFLLGRVGTAGLTAAAFAAAAAAAAGTAAGAAAAIGSPVRGSSGNGSDSTTDLTRLDAEYDARTPSPAQRRASRRLGRQLIRAARAGWPHAALDAVLGVHPEGPHQPVAFGAAAAAAGLGASDAAAVAALGAVTGPAGAATRLLGLDPDDVTAVLAALAPDVRRIAETAAVFAGRPVEELPAASAFLLDISAEHHATWEVRLFAS